MNEQTGAALADNWFSGAPGSGTTSAGSIPAFKTPDEAAAHLGIDLPPSMTPDGVWRSYTSGRDTHCSRKVNPDGSGILRRFSRGDDGFAAWRADPSLAAGASTVDAPLDDGEEPGNDDDANDDAELIQRIASYLKDQCIPAEPTHPYALRKRITVTGWYQEKTGGFGSTTGPLIVPFGRDVGGAPSSFQAIYADGKKRSAAGIAGAFTGMGPAAKDGDVVVLIGSPSTGRTISDHAPDVAVYAAAGDANLRAAARAVLRSLAKAGVRVQPLILGDDDWKGDSEKVGDNSGVKAAQRVARAVGGLAGWPRWPDGAARAKGDADFKDLLCSQPDGAAEVARQLSLLLDAARKLPLVEPQDSEPCAEEFTSRAEAREYLVQRYGHIASNGAFWDRKLRVLVGAAVITSAMLHRMPRDAEGKRADSVGLLLTDARSKYDKLDYHPGKGRTFTLDGDTRVLNSYVPSGVLPLPGAGASIFEDHVFYLSGHDAAAAALLLDWIAFLVQHPGEKITWAPVLMSKQHGTGRGLLFSVLRLLLGPANVVIADSKHLGSNFNLASALTQLLCIPEAYVPATKNDRMSVWDIAKTRIADEFIFLEAKGKDAIQIPNRGNIIMATNYPDALPIDGFDRRVWACESELGPKPTAYYVALREWINGPDCAGAVLAALFARPLDKFLPGAAPPMTRAKQSMIERARGPAEQHIREAAESRSGPFGGHLLRSADINKWLNDEHRSHMSDVAITDLLKTLGAVRVNKGAGVPLADGSRPKIWALRERMDDAQHNQMHAILAAQGRLQPHELNTLIERYEDMSASVLAAIWDAPHSVRGVV